MLVVGLHALADKLAKYNYSPDEVMQSRVARQLNLKSIEGIQNNTLHTKLHNLRCFWKKKHEEREATRTLYRHISGRNDAWTINTMIGCACVMTDNGVHSIADLDSLNVNDFKRDDDTAKDILNDLIEEQTEIGNGRRTRASGVGSATHVEKVTKDYVAGKVVLPNEISKCAETNGPMKAIKMATPCVGKRSRELLLEGARVLTVIESAKKSLPSRLSGVKCWRIFSEEWLGVPANRSLPPNISGLLLWSRFFRCPGTFSNYCSYVQWACDLEGVDAPDLKSPLLRRARQAVKGKWVPRQKTWITKEILEDMMMQVRNEKDEAWLMLFLASYIFLLRLPSEALPMRTCDGTREDLKRGHTKSELSMKGNTIVLRLQSRKNEPVPTLLSRGCWCATAPLICPVHVLGSWAFQPERKGALFAGITPTTATKNLRSRLEEIELLNARLFTTHAFRRGHARDMAMAGVSAVEIMKMGGWHSSAFIGYIDPRELEDLAVLETHMYQSDSDED